MSRSRHEEIQHCFCGVLEPDAGDQPIGESDSGFDPVQRLRSTIAQMPFLQTRISLRRHRHFHRRRHPQRHRLPSARLPTPLLHVDCRRPTRTRHPDPHIQILRRPPHLRRQQLWEPHAANERLWTPLSWAQGSCRGLFGQDEV